MFGLGLQLAGSGELCVNERYKFSPGIIGKLYSEQNLGLYVLSGCRKSIKPESEQSHNITRCIEQSRNPSCIQETICL